MNALNFESRVWTRAAAAVERFWSPREVRDVEDAARRLSDHACRLNLRGVAASPVRPGFCPADVVGPRGGGSAGGGEEGRGEGVGGGEVRDTVRSSTQQVEAPKRASLLAPAAASGSDVLVVEEEASSLLNLFLGQQQQQQQRGEQR